MLSTCGKFKGFIENKPIDLREVPIIPTLETVGFFNRILFKRIGLKLLLG